MCFTADFGMFIHGCNKISTVIPRSEIAELGDIEPKLNRNPVLTGSLYEKNETKTTTVSGATAFQNAFKQGV